MDSNTTNASGTAGAGGDAAQIHRDLVVVDAHSDVFCDVVRRRLLGETQVLQRLHVPEWRAGGVDVVVTTLYTEEEHKPDRALRRATLMLGAALNDLDEAPDMALCTTQAEIDAALAEGRIACVLAMEGGEPIQDGIEALRVFRDMGVRILGLTWNQRNLLAEGVGEERANGGLTELGREMVREANRLGVMLDVSHLAVRSFWDLLEESRAPVIASHANAKALCGHRRNLDDEQLRALAQVGGFIGVCGVAAFINDDPEQATLEGALDHIDYIARLVGVQHVGLGPDFVDYLLVEPGTDVLPTNPTNSIGPQGFARIADMPALTAGLLTRGYSHDEVRGIVGGNALRVLSSVLV